MNTYEEHKKMMTGLDERLLYEAEIPEYRASQVILSNGIDLTPSKIRWLWPGWLANGKLHILAGAPGQGKTTIAMALAAVVTEGGKWPDGQYSSTGSVLIWSGEDDPADTLLPRLLAAGADRSKCYFVAGTHEDGRVRSFDLTKDLSELEEAAKQIGDVKLIIVDPIVNAVAGDSHKNTEVRRDLQPLVDLGARLDAAILGITHFNKGGADRDPTSRVMGSVAFTAFARVVMVAGQSEDADGVQRRVLARSKSNIGSDHGGFAYEIKQVELDDGIWSSKIEWGQELTGNARELLAEPEQDSGQGKRSAVDVAMDFLKQILCDGPMPVKEIAKEADAAGISWSAIKRAHPKMNIISKKGIDHWYWQLARSIESDQEVQEAQEYQGEQNGGAEFVEEVGSVEHEQEEVDAQA